MNHEGHEEHEGRENKSLELPAFSLFFLRVLRVLRGSKSKLDFPAGLNLNIFFHCDNIKSKPLKKEKVWGKK